MPFKAKLMYYFVPAHAPWVYKEATMEKKTSIARHLNEYSVCVS